MPSDTRKTTSLAKIILARKIVTANLNTCNKTGKENVLEV